MPTYEYLCGKCGLKFDRQQSMKDLPLSECPECQGKIQRLVSGGAGFIMKSSELCGSGPNAQSCSLEDTGVTCCGMAERCGKPQCGS
jgi:putative FmdB family regulatory protein